MRKFISILIFCCFIIVTKAQITVEKVFISPPFHLQLQKDGSCYLWIDICVGGQRVLIMSEANYKIKTNKKTSSYARLIVKANKKNKAKSELTDYHFLKNRLFDKLVFDYYPTIHQNEGVLYLKGSHFTGQIKDTDYYWYNPSRKYRLKQKPDMCFSSWDTSNEYEKSVIAPLLEMKVMPPNCKDNIRVCFLPLPPPKIF